MKITPFENTAEFDIDEIVEYYERFADISKPINSEENFIKTVSNYLEDSTLHIADNYPPADLNVYGFIVALNRMNWIMTRCTKEEAINFIKNEKFTINELKQQLMKLFTTTFCSQRDPSRLLIIEDDDIHPTEPPMKFEFPCDPKSMIVQKVIRKWIEIDRPKLEKKGFGIGKVILPAYLN